MSEPPSTPREYSVRSLAEAPPVGAHGDCPTEVTDKANAAFELFEHNLDSSIWAEAKLESDSGGVVIKSVLLEGEADGDSGPSKSRRFLTTFTLRGVTASAVYSALMCYENRVKWDSGLADPAWLQRWRSGDDECDIICYTIKPVAILGLPVISARAIMDVRTTRTAGNVLTTASFEALGEQLPSDSGVAEWRAVADSKGFVHARNLPGGGVKFTEHDGVVDVILLAATEFGGQVPPSILNNATGKALSKLVSDLASHLSAPLVM
jgi:hypothetical protein